MNPTVSVMSYRLPMYSNARVVGSSVSNSRSSTVACAPVSAFSSVDFPTLVYPASAIVGVAERARLLSPHGALRAEAP